MRLANSKYWREMHCACPFHGVRSHLEGWQTLVGWRRDKPAGKPLVNHGHVCSACAVMYTKGQLYWDFSALDRHVAKVLHPKSILLPDEIGLELIPAWRMQWSPRIIDSQVAARAA